MTRRHSLYAAAALGMPAAAATKSQIFELRYLRLRNGSQIQRTNEFFSRHYLPATQRLGIGPCGFFNPFIAEQGPFLLVLQSYASLAALETALDKLASDREFQKGFDEYNSMSEPSYVRMESSLLRGFESLPGIEAPPTDSKRPSRIFELRTYEANNTKASKRKIKMFDDAEIQIFRRCGMLPVFFGETLVGRNLPNLTYMLAYDDWAAREKGWRAFGADPEWQKLRVQPGLTDPEIVSNISNALLRPAAYSPIR
ncbi:MAG: NIPSNAP family protein [Acidobacteria bacterium]|nr:NIPSNAP family protein [Acidobacteriota bacterium]MBI3473082.1 NIPSNAP family protein [Candidatus Solibacter usitatus]